MTVINLALVRILNYFMFPIITPLVIELFMKMFWISNMSPDRFALLLKSKLEELWGHKVVAVILHKFDLLLMFSLQQQYILTVDKASKGTSLQCFEETFLSNIPAQPLPYLFSRPATRIFLFHVNPQKTYPLTSPTPSFLPTHILTAFIFLLDWKNKGAQTHIEPQVKLTLIVHNIEIFYVFNNIIDLKKYWS